MSIAGPIDQRPESSEPAARPGRRGPLSRRAVLGAAAAGGVGIAALRVLAYPEIEQLVRRTRATAAGGRGDWVSPLASERARHALSGREIERVIVRAPRLVNVVTRR